MQIQFSFSEETDYTYDEDKVEVVSGHATLKDQCNILCRL